jgi:hypothetical protein
VVWKATIDRFFSLLDGCVAIQIGDFGAGPGVVLLRREHAAAEFQHA